MPALTAIPSSVISLPHVEKQCELPEAAEVDHHQPSCSPALDEPRAIPSLSQIPSNSYPHLRKCLTQERDAILTRDDQSLVLGDTNNSLSRLGNIAILTQNKSMKMSKPKYIDLQDFCSCFTERNRVVSGPSAGLRIKNAHTQTCNGFESL